MATTFCHRYMYIPTSGSWAVKPLVACHNPSYPTCSEITDDQFLATIKQQIHNPSLTLETKAYLSVAHLSPQDAPVKNSTHWMLCTQALIHLTRMNALSPLKFPIGSAHTDWQRELENYTLEKTDFPAHVKEHLSMRGMELLNYLRAAPFEWVCALAGSMHSDVYSDPNGKVHDSPAIFPRAMVSTNRYGTCFTFSTVHMDKTADGSYIALKLDYTHGVGVAGPKNNPVLKNEQSLSLKDWWNIKLQSLRPHKVPDSNILTPIVAIGLKYGLTEEEIIAIELPRAMAKNASSCSRKLMELAIGEEWAIIERQVRMLEDLGYKDDLPRYLWAYFSRRARLNQEKNESIDLKNMF